MQERHPHKQYWITLKQMQSRLYQEQEDGVGSCAGGLCSTCHFWCPCSEPFATLTQLRWEQKAYPG